MLQTGLTAVLACTAIFAFIAMLIFWRKKGWFIQWLRGSAGFAMLMALVMLGFSLVDLWSYQRVVEQRPLATFSIYQTGDQAFDITLVNTAGIEQRYQIQGDQWQLDARLLSWTGPVAQMQDEALYRLERLSGRYLSLEQERNMNQGQQRSGHQLEQSRWFDLWAWLEGQSLWLEARSEQAVYLPLENGAVFAVVMTPQGLQADALNDVAEQALASWQ